MMVNFAVRGVSVHSIPFVIEGRACMLNRYPLWKYLLILVVLVVGLIYSLPNLFPEDPAIQISSAQGDSLDARQIDRVETAKPFRAKIDRALCSRWIFPVSHQILASRDRLQN